MKNIINKVAFGVCVLSVTLAYGSHPLDMVEIDADVADGQVCRHGDKFDIPQSFRASYKNKLGQAVFSTLPVVRNWMTGSPEPGSGWSYYPLGEFIDINGDGLPDFIISYHEELPSYPFYRATFINDGKYNWIMVACEQNINRPWIFAPCQ